MLGRVAPPRGVDPIALNLIIIPALVPGVTFLGAALPLDPPMVARVTTTFIAAMQDMVEGGGGGVEGKGGRGGNVKLRVRKSEQNGARATLQGAS